MERVITLDKERDWAGVYSVQMRGLHRTAMIYDGTVDECHEWLALLQNSERTDMESERLKELSLASNSCPYFKKVETEEIDFLSALIV